MKRKKQPTDDVMREQLRLAADEIISLRQRLSVFCEPDSPYQINVIRSDRLTPQQQARIASAWRDRYTPSHKPWWHRLAFWH